MSHALSPALFPAYFKALWGKEPFDWQTRLLKKVHGEGWPTTLDLPTGSGKTATLDVALFALALDTTVAVEQRRQARRIVLVVDRRVVVDQAYERAVAIANRLAEARDGILADVAKALRELSGDPTGQPVLPTVLRGGMPREAEWAKSPSQPVIMTSTVDQVGSRLLFRGYGVSERMRSIHAGLLGCDTLLLLDEVHLARPFEETLRALTSRYSTRVEGLRPLTFVRMSATVTDQSEYTFRLDEADRTNPVLNERLTATKRATLRQVSTQRDPIKVGEALARAAVKEARRLGKGTPRAMAIIVNRVETARKIAALALDDMGDEWSVRLLTGRMRPLDRLDRQAAILEQIASGRTRTPDSSRLLLVSTQAIEAGADFDFDALITECASLDALRQRFGRLDRLGKLRETQAVVLAASSAVDEKAEDDPIYGAALRKTWHWLNTVATWSPDVDASIVDFGIDAIDARVSELEQAALSELAAPRATAPILTSSHLDRWAQTSPTPHADPEVAQFLHGLGRGAPEVQLVWRADVTRAIVEEATSVRSETLLSGLGQILELVRPSSLEALSVPLWTARHWLADVYSRTNEAVADTPQSVPGLADVEGQPEVEAEGKVVAPTIAWQGNKVTIVRTANDISPGATLVVPSEYGGLDPNFDCWDPSSTTFVKDRGDEAHLLQRGRAVLRWSPTVIASWANSAPQAILKGPQVTKAQLDDDGTAAERQAFLEWQTKALGMATLPEWAKAALGHLSRLPLTQSVALSQVPSADDETSNDWRVSFHPRKLERDTLRSLFRLPSLCRTSPPDGDSLTTEDDDASFLGGAVSLSAHLQGVEAFARRFGKSLALPNALIADLALAGWLHDLGKADPRFQLLLHGGDAVREASAAELVAKSSIIATDQTARERARERSGYPRGMRHELLSVALIENDAQLRERASDWDLVLHLVASHHGWCRPFAPPVHDPEPRTVSVSLEGTTWSASTAHELARFDSVVTQRYWSLTRKYGYWGLAWLESVLRLADHRESEREMSKEPKQ